MPPYKGEALDFHKNFCHLCHLINYVMKVLLSDAESHEEHNETKYSPIGQTMAECWTFCTRT